MAKKISRRKFLKTSSGLAVMAGVGGSGILLKGCRAGQKYDLVIKGGRIYDGLGRDPFRADIGIIDNKISTIGKISGTKGKTVLEVEGNSVCPGFIDVHDHSDMGLLVNPKAESHISQGITTLVSGNCGSSPFPVAEEIHEEIKANILEQYQLDLTWSDIKGFLSKLEEKGIAINYSTLVGHGSIRGAVVGFHDRPAKTEELLKMKNLVDENMMKGAIGLSTGLEYTPGSFAGSNEITELCQVVARLNGVYATHMRSEGDDLISSLEESIDVARKTGVSLQISHLKAAYPSNWHKIDDVINVIESAKKEGINIFCDRYSYIAASTGLSFYMPLWVRQGTTEEFISRLKDPMVETRLREHLALQEKKLGAWDKVMISEVITEKNKEFVGKTILEAHQKSGKDSFEFIRDILIEEQGRVGMIIFMMKEENLKRILSHPLVGVGCDGAVRAPYGILGEGKPHPRNYGTFPRILGKYIRDERIIPMQAMIKKMTSLPASKFGFEKRGSIQAGNMADIVVFNESKVTDMATFEQPHQYSKGIEYVLVNGKVVLDKDGHTAGLPGKVLRKTLR